MRPSRSSGISSAISGGNLYRKSSFLLDSLGKQVLGPSVSIFERPHLKRGLASAPFDNEGVATQERELVANGVLQGYMLSSYSARKLGLATTAATEAIAFFIGSAWRHTWSRCLFLDRSAMRSVFALAIATAYRWRSPAGARSLPGSCWFRSFRWRHRRASSRR